jgi:hypothetical protein
MLLLVRFFCFFSFSLRVARIGPTETGNCHGNLSYCATITVHKSRRHSAILKVANPSCAYTDFCFSDTFFGITAYNLSLNPTTSRLILSPIPLLGRLVAVIAYVAQLSQRFDYSIQIKSSSAASLTTSSGIAPIKPGKIWCLLSPNHDYTRSSPMGRRLCKKSCRIRREKRLRNHDSL